MSDSINVYIHFWAQTLPWWAIDLKARWEVRDVTIVAAPLNGADSWPPYNSTHQITVRVTDVLPVVSKENPDSGLDRRLVEPYFHWCPVALCQLRMGGRLTGLRISTAGTCDLVCLLAHVSSVLLGNITFVSNALLLCAMPVVLNRNSSHDENPL